jgi:predicted transcriptional regulator
VLDDTARKVLTVMWNVYRNDPSGIDTKYISQRSQRTEEQVKSAINHLVTEGFVLWDRKDNTFRVLYNREDAKHKPSGG